MSNQPNKVKQQVRENNILMGKLHKNLSLWLKAEKRRNRRSNERDETERDLYFDKPVEVQENQSKAWIDGELTGTEYTD